MVKDIFVAVQVFGTSHGVLAIASQFDWVVDFLRNERRASGYYILLATWKTFLTVKTIMEGGPIRSKISTFIYG